MKQSLEELGLSASVMALIEGFPARVPTFPGDNSSLEDSRLIPGGPSSSELLRLREADIKSDVESVVAEVVRLRQKASAANILLNGIAPMQNAISAALARVDSLSGSIVGSVVDFYSPGTALTSASICSYEPLYGQVSLPYASNPQSQILRSQSYGPRPGTILRYARIPRLSDSSPQYSFAYDDTDPDVTFGIDGRLDTSWSTPINSETEDLVISIKLPPTLGASVLVNALGIIPWPAFGTSIIEVWILNGGSSNSVVPGWTELSMAGQLGYNPSSQIITTATAHRLLFIPGPVREIFIRLRPINISNIGLINVDCWAIEFKPVGSIVIDASLVGIANVATATLAGLNPSSLSRLPVSRNGSQITVDLSSATPYDSPIITSIGIQPVPQGQEDTGFDYQVFA